MQDSQSDFVTQLLEQVAAGDHAAQERLFELVYDELRDVAHWMMKGERGSHTLQPTALVNEAVLRLLNTDRLQEMPNRRYFFAAAARATRRVLVDHARHRDRQSSPKGEERQRVLLDDVVDQISGEQDIDLLALDEALVQLKTRSPRQHNIVELKYFGGFKMKEIAEQLNLSKPMVEKDLHFAQAWLGVQMEGAQSDE